MGPRSFLPQIVGVFYAAFDPKLGPTVLHQVPENLITSTSRQDDGRSRSVSRSRPSSIDDAGPSSISRGRTREEREDRSLSTQLSLPHSLPRSASPTGPTLLDFAPLSDYVIPKKSLYGRLVTVLTTGHDAAAGTGDDEKVEYRIMGFPSLIMGQSGRYQRNEYMWNLCFVFHGSSSVEAFEPVVRKCGRILRSAEVSRLLRDTP